jgi:hypothetical protein
MNGLRNHIDRKSVSSAGLRPPLHLRMIKLGRPEPRCAKRGYRRVAFEPIVWLISGLVTASCSRDAPVAENAIAGRNCTDCEIVLTRVGIMTDSADPGSLPDQAIYAERDSQGRLYTVSRSRTAVIVFDSLGVRLAELGGLGEGPGEFRAIRRLFVTPGDSLYVSDWVTARMTVYDPSLTFVRTQPSPYPPSLVLPDGSFVVAEQILTRKEIGYPIHVVDRAGRLLRSFGTDTPQYRSDMKLIINRLVSTASSGRVWAVAQGRYTIDLWNPASGGLEHRSKIESSWFREIAKWNYDERTRPGSIIESLWEGQDGVIWIVFRVAEVNWQIPPRANEERVISEEEYQKTYDWIIEAVDPQRNVVLASRRFDGIFWVRPPSRVIVSARADSDTTARLVVLEPKLTNKGRAQ